MLLKYSQLKIYKIALVVIINLICLTSVAQNDITEFKVISISRDTLSLISDTNRTHLIILSNNNACRDCFRPLNRPSDIINAKINSDSLDIKFLCRVDNSSRSRRLHMNLLKQDMPKIANDTNIFFDIYSDEYVYNQLAKSGIFGHFKINSTPAAIIYDPETGVEIFPYTILYGYLKTVETFSINGLRKYRDLHY